MSQSPSSVAITGFPPCNTRISAARSRVDSKWVSRRAVRGQLYNRRDACESQLFLQIRLGWKLLIHQLRLLLLNIFEIGFLPWFHSSVNDDFKMGCCQNVLSFKNLIGGSASTFYMLESTLKFLS